MNLKTIYQSILNPDLQADTLDQALKAAEADPDNLELRQWFAVFIIEDSD